MHTPRSVPTQRRGKHNTEVEEGEKRGEKDTSTGLREGKTEPRERERERSEEPGKPSLPNRGLGSTTSSTRSPPASCTQVVGDNQRALEGLESIAHQVNEVLHNTEQVHRARGHLGTENV